MYVCLSRQIFTFDIITADTVGHKGTFQAPTSTTGLGNRDHSRIYTPVFGFLLHLQRPTFNALAVPWSVPPATVIRARRARRKKKKKKRG